MKKIAVPVSIDNRVDEHFGHCEFYGIFTVNEKNEITDFTRIASASGCGCKSNIASELASMGVEYMLAGGIGAGAIQVLAASGIQVVRGCSGDASSVVSSWLEGRISDSGESCLQHEQHHGQGHSHECNH
jgi:predicted Fe-Mo cluster-binding NifX family protein